MVEILQQDDINSMEKCGKILAATMDEISRSVKPGISAATVDKIAELSIRKRGGRPSFLGYGDKKNPFPATICFSMNDEIVHGIPLKNKIIRDGDIVSIDIGAEYKGIFTDMAKTFIAGKAKHPNDIKLLKITQESLERGILSAVVNGRTGDIGHTIQSYVEANGFSVVKVLVGHGIGHHPHQDPQIPNFGNHGNGFKLVKNQAIAIEPMVHAGLSDISNDDDGWTIKTFDGSNSAHFEHTILITEVGPKIMTKL